MHTKSRSPFFVLFQQFVFPFFLGAIILLPSICYGRTATINSYGEMVNGVAGNIFAADSDELKVIPNVTITNPTANTITATITHSFDGRPEVGLAIPVAANTAFTFAFSDADFAGPDFVRGFSMSIDVDPVVEGTAIFERAQGGGGGGPGMEE